MAPRVMKTSRAPATISRTMPPISAPRWEMTGRAIVWRISGRTSVGPGVNRMGRMDTGIPSRARTNRGYAGESGAGARHTLARADESLSVPGAGHWNRFLILSKLLEFLAMSR